MRNRTLLFLILLMPFGVLAEESCEQVAQRISVIGLQSEGACATRTVKEIGALLELSSPDECDLMVACSETKSPAECASGIRQLVRNAEEHIKEGSISWASLSASLLQYTDSEMTAELLVGLSYLLPGHPEVLSEVIAQNPHVKRWTRSIVDPAPDLREIEDRCAYFSEIASTVGDLRQSEIDEEITHWANESYQVYRCD